MLPFLLKEEIDELVEKTYRFCHGYLSGPLYLTPGFEKYMSRKGISFCVTERVATWQEGKPRLRVAECNDLEMHLQEAAEHKGRRLFENNTEAAIFSSNVLNENWTEDTKWLLKVRREHVGTVYIVNPDTREFLLIFHRKLGRWLPPGGHVEEHENNVQAAIREAKEELGINVHLIMMKGDLEKDGLYYRQVPSDSGSHAFCVIEEFIHPIGAQDPHIHVYHIYVGTVAPNEKVKKWSKEEVTAVDFFSIQQIEQLNTYDNVPVVCKAILKEIEKSDSSARRIYDEDFRRISF